MATLGQPELAGLLEAAPDAIVAVDSSGRVLLVNAQAERLFGYPHDELVGQLVELLVPEAARMVHPGHRRRYIADGRPRPMGAGMELAGRRRDGSEFPAEVTLSTIETADGRVVAAAIRDASERVRGAKAVSQLASIVQTSHDAIVSTTPEGIIESWNPGAERLYGYSAADVVGLHSDLLVAPHRIEEESSKLRRVVTGERVEQYETDHIRQDGSIVSVSLTVAAITDSAGGLVGVASIARDLTDRRRADARFRALLEGAPDAVLCVDAAGSIRLANAQAERLFGYPRGEIIGQSIEMLVPDEARGVHPTHRLAYFRDPQPRPMGVGMQLRARCRDGTEFPAEISLSALEMDDGLLVSAAVRDVTDRLAVLVEAQRLRAEAERERVERQLQQSQRLESLGQLAGGVAHDFNNLLGAVINYAHFVSGAIEAASTQDTPADWEVVLRDVRQIQLAASRATALTRQLLAFARHEVVSPRVLDLNEIVRTLEPLLNRTLGEHIELLITLAPDSPMTKADPGQLEQVLVNLAVNARDAMPDGGLLTIDTDDVTADDDYASMRPGLLPGRYARLRVSDTGEGMTPEVVERAFEPFFTTKPKGEGTGLGLATVYGIITQSGGQCQVYSERGIGTAFTVLLPATDEQPTSKAADIADVRLDRGATVLVVEDEELMREVTTRILERNAYHVLSASSGQEALDVTARYDGVINLLLTDVVMPKMMGKEVAERVRALRPGTRVLFMSGYARPVLGERGTLAPGVFLIDKPFSEATLLEKVREVLDDELLHGEAPKE